MIDLKKKHNLIALVAMALILFPAGFIAGNIMADESEPSAANNSETADDKADIDHRDDDHSEHDDKSHSHSHPQLDVPAAGAPAITNLSVVEDAKSGWNVTITVDNFTFTPEAVNADHVSNQGHAHIYVDGQKLARMYGATYHIDHLDEGEHTIMVTLNTNDHQDYAIGGETIKAMTTIVDDHHSGDSSGY